MTTEYSLKSAIASGARFVQCRPYDYHDPEKAKSPINSSYTESGLDTAIGCGACHMAGSRGRRPAWLCPVLFAVPLV